uniref:Uncharacterized protein n=1 Tax=Opuntia streptacantha TaxID=393608 RepID=A0A7C9E631_OPUST
MLRHADDQKQRRTKICTGYTTLTTSQLGMFNNAMVSIEALGRLLASWENFRSNEALASNLSHVLNHFACMYFCFLHGAICIFLSFMHFLAAVHKILTRARSRSTFPTKTSGNRLINLLYSSLALAISNSALKFNSIITLISPFFGFELSITSTYVCSPAGISGVLLHLDLQIAQL